jgi:hypothetical protein
MQDLPSIVVALAALVSFMIVAVMLAVNDWRKRINLRGLEIAGPEGVIDNRNNERRQVQFYRIKVKNVAGKPLRNCEVRMTSMRDSNGIESREVGRHLWLSRQRGNLDPLGTHPVQSKRFDLPVDGAEWFDIAYLDPIKPTHIRMCYAQDESDRDVFINFGGLVSKCPYLIEVEATSDECRPERIEIEHVVEGSRLIFRRVQRPQHRTSVFSSI